MPPEAGPGPSSTPARPLPAGCYERSTRREPVRICSLLDDEPVDPGPASGKIPVRLALHLVLVLARIDVDQDETLDTRAGGGSGGLPTGAVGRLILWLALRVPGFMQQHPAPGGQLDVALVECGVGAVGEVVADPQ